MRRRFSYANVAATLALVLAMSGGALAAKSYVINSLSQINPKVQKKLKGNRGARGAAGIAGKEGAPGKEGAAGKEGPGGKEGAPGKNGTGTALFFKAKAGTANTTIASLDGAEIQAECNAKTEAIVKLHVTASHGIYHGAYDIEGKGTEVFEDNLKEGENFEMQKEAKNNDYEGWFSYLGPHGGITTGIFGDDSGGSNSKQCLVWGNIESSSTGSTGGA